MRRSTVQVGQGGDGVKEVRTLATARNQFQRPSWVTTFCLNPFSKHYIVIDLLYYFDVEGGATVCYSV